MKLLVDIDKDYYEQIKYTVEHGQDFKPYAIIAKGIPLEEGPQKGVAKVCKNCEYYFYGQCYGQKNAPKVDANEVNKCWIERQ